MRSFKLFLRCECCRLEVAYLLNFPREDHAPLDVDDLLEDAVLSRQPFQCGRCGGEIGMLTGAVMLPADAEAV